MTPRRVIATDLLVGYRTNPHIDTWETGRAAARHLADLLAGAPRPHVVFGTVPLIAPAIAQATSQWPLGGWLLRGQQLERRHDFVDVTMHGGYAYADVAHAGMAVTISTRGDVVVAEEAANELCQLAWSMRDQLQPQLPTAQQAIGAIPKDTGPVALADTGDNINGGSPGDHLDLIEAAASSGLSCLGTWVHRELLRDALSAAPDSQVELPGPLARAVGSTTGIVVAHAAGTFINKGPMATGKRMDIGRSAVIRIAGLDLLLQGRAAQPNDPEMFRSAGLEPANYDAVLLKGASALRAGWAGVASTFVAVSTPGESDTDLRRLAYRRLEGRVWPLTDRPSRSVNVLRIR